MHLKNLPIKPSVIIYSQSILDPLIINLPKQAERFLISRCHSSLKLAQGFRKSVFYFGGFFSQKQSANKQCLDYAGNTFPSKDKPPNLTKMIGDSGISLKGLLCFEVC